MRTQFSHAVFHVDPANLPFYADLFAFLGWGTIAADATMLGVSSAGDDTLWLMGVAKAGVANDYDGPGLNHIAIGTEAQADVDMAAAYLGGRGVTMLFETPRHRPEFSSNASQTYYQIMFETPDRILVEIVYTGPKAA